MRASVGALLVVDDDPTGAQGQADVPLLLSWRGGLLDAALRDEPRAVHLLTNSRALDEDAAYAIVRDAAETAAAGASRSPLVLRGDSTLRAHLLPEYAAVRDATAPGANPPLLLVPALPAAGRVTLGGRHWLIRGGRRIPLERTEFASDGAFAYDSSRLVQWADQRSGGYFAAAAGAEIGLAEIRAQGGAEAVRAALVSAAAASDPGVVVPDAEDEADLRVIADGLRQAWATEPAIVVRCAPAFASTLSGAAATELVAPPTPKRGLLAVVGSHVPMSSAQLASLRSTRPDAFIELDASLLAAGGPGSVQAVSAAATEATELLRKGGLAVVATSRAVIRDGRGPAAGVAVARALAEVVSRLRTVSDVLLSKGGITSAVNVREGLHAERAQVVGPVAPGISLWRVFADGGCYEYPVIVFPGNVGEAGTLAELVTLILGDGD